MKKCAMHNKQKGIAVLIPVRDETHIQIKVVARNKESHFMMKGLSYQRYLMIINIYTLKNRAHRTRSKN